MCFSLVAIFFGEHIRLFVNRHAPARQKLFEEQFEALVRYAGALEDAGIGSGIIAKLGTPEGPIAEVQRAVAALRRLRDLIVATTPRLPPASRAAARDIVSKVDELCAQVDQFISILPRKSDFARPLIDSAAALTTDLLAEREAAEAARLKLAGHPTG